MSTDKPLRRSRGGIGSGAAGSYHHGNLRDALVRATVKLVQERGPEAVTLRAVAAASGVSEAAPYHHFRDKTELLATAAAAGYRALEVVLVEARDARTGTPAQAVARMGAAYVRFALAQPGAYRLMFGAHMVELARVPEVRAAASCARRALQTAIELQVTSTGTPLGSTRTFQLVWAQVHGLAWLLMEQEIRDPSLDPSEVAEHAILAFLSGLERQGEPGGGVARTAGATGTREATRGEAGPGDPSVGRRSGGAVVE